MVPFTVEEENLICLYVSQERPAQNGGQHSGRPAGHGRGHGGAGPPDRRQAGRHARRRL